MKVIDIEHVVADFDRLVERAAAGEAFVISKDGAPLVVVRPVSRRTGFMAGEFGVPDDFDEMFRDEIERMFYGA